ncbi:MAG: tRNA (adenosine(37)-N6)-threonylcarbamoyltransferase complex ATPase subunit type 1 TsaE [Clostridiales bacterium]|nr:tRNA (adenosine(37)-N6)-threonylcarbamoyltransferase complex ATPase subunit type 1 TsaE [Clostridiales bacterium]
MAINVKPNRDRQFSHNVVTVSTPRQMEKLGEKLSKTLSGGDVVLLTGELGAGKTVLCKGIAKGLGVTAPVTSPTFTIMNEYFGVIEFCHFDAYRLESADEAFGAGLTDFIGNKDCICAVEWWQNIEELFEDCKTVKIDIKKIDDKLREVIIDNELLND